MATSTANSLAKSTAGASEHLRCICEFSLNRPPIRTKIDRQSYDELKPVVQRAVALLDWYNALRQQFTGFIGELATAGGTPSPEHLALLVEAIDACVLLENQFGGWSACINRFSWFKRTLAQIRRELSADPDADQFNRDIPRFQAFIGNAQFPIGMHMSGPLRGATKKVPDHERLLLTALFQFANAALGTGSAAPEASVLRPLPYLLYLADGDASAGAFNVFTATKLQPVQKVFKRHPTADCGAPQEMIRALGLPLGHPVHLGTVLARCPHYTTAMRSKWGMPKQPGDGPSCVLL